MIFLRLDPPQKHKENGMRFVMLDPQYSIERLGYLPTFASDSDPRPVREQFNENYAHGGGWHPMPGWTRDPDTSTITYIDGMETYHPIAFSFVHEQEEVFVYEHAWVCIVQPDGSFEVARMD